MPEPPAQRRELHAPKAVMVNTQTLTDPWTVAILLEWRRIGDGPWEGLTVYAYTVRSPRSVQHWSVRTEWVDAQRIREVAPSVPGGRE